MTSHDHLTLPDMLSNDHVPTWCADKSSYVRSFYKSVRQCLLDTVSRKLPKLPGSSIAAHATSPACQEDEDMPPGTDVTPVSSLVQAINLGALTNLCGASAEVGAALPHLLNRFGVCLLTVCCHEEEQAHNSPSF